MDSSSSSVSLENGQNVKNSDVGQLSVSENPEALGTGNNSEDSSSRYQSQLSIHNKRFRLFEFHTDIVRDIWSFSLLLVVITAVLFSSFSKIKPSVDRLGIFPKVNVTEEMKFTEFLGFAGIIIGLFYNAKSIHHQYHQEKLNRASGFVAKWYSPEVKILVGSAREIKKEVYDLAVVKRVCTDSNCPNSVLCQRGEQPTCFSKEGVEIPTAYALRKDSKVRNLIYKSDPSHQSDPKKQNNYTEKDIEKSVDDLINKIRQETYTKLINENNKSHRDNVKSVLEFFEHMAQDVHLKVVDEDYLKHFFFYVVVGYYEVLFNYIQSLQTKYNNRLLYCNFVKMAERWEKTGPLEAL